VGSAQSGSQIAEELYQSGRRVYLSVGSAGRLPRRYRGRDVTRWLDELGLADRTVDQLPSPRAKFGGSAHGTGKNGGHTINLHQFARDGVVLLGHLESVEGEHVTLAPDLHDSLRRADKLEADFVKQVDAHIEERGLSAPQETLPLLRDGYNVDLILDLDLPAAGITTVVWATGYAFDYGLVKLPAFDADGYPVQKRGVTEHPGLYFVGLPWLHTLKSGLLAGVGEDAAYVAAAISRRDGT
jgi:putative flavoprotein involved in K+ transport